MKAHHFLIAVAAMAAIIAGSNYLVQFPVHVTLGAINLADLLTYAAFTFPVAFLVTDLTNKLFGAGAARKVVYAGFAIAVLVSIIVASPRIAIASGSAFLISQLLDVSIFDRLHVHRGLEQRFVSSGIQPCGAAAKTFDAQLPTPQVLAVEVGYLKLAPGRRFKAPGCLRHPVVIEIEPGDSVTRARLRRFLFKTDRVTLLVELNHPVALRIAHRIGKHECTLSQGCGLL